MADMAKASRLLVAGGRSLRYCHLGKAPHEIHLGYRSP
jgi:hypothetical protein